MARGRSWFYGPCPDCKAKAGVDCKRPSGHYTFPPHVNRPVIEPCPECGGPVLERDHCQLVDDNAVRRVFAHNRCLGLPEDGDTAQPIEGQEVLF